MVRCSRVIIWRTLTAWEISTQIFHVKMTEFLNYGTSPDHYLLQRLHTSSAGHKRGYFRDRISLGNPSRPNRHEWYSIDQVNPVLSSHLDDYCIYLRLFTCLNNIKKRLAPAIDAGYLLNGQYLDDQSQSFFDGIEPLHSSIESPSSSNLGSKMCMRG